VPKAAEKEKPKLSFGKVNSETPNIFNRTKKEVKEEVEESAENRSEPFTQEQLSEAWSKYKSQKMEEGSGDMEAIVLSRNPVKEEDDTITLVLSSALEIQILDRFEADLVGFLRNSLKNDQININKKVEEIKEGRKLYTSKDKYEYLVEQNPAVKDLKDKLGLDFEY